MAAPVITYTRTRKFLSCSYVEKPSKDALAKDPKAKGNTKTAYGLVGSVLIGGLEFNTIERIDRMYIEPGKDYSNSTIYWKPDHDPPTGFPWPCYVVNPWLGRQEKTKYNVLFHPATRPSELQGCVGVGFFKDSDINVMEDGQLAMKMIWDLCGGRNGVKTGHIVITVRVVGDMPASHVGLTRWDGNY